jgi:hypothetical protein
MSKLKLSTARSSNVALSAFENLSLTDAIVTVSWTQLEAFKARTRIVSMGVGAEMNAPTILVLAFVIV